MINIQNAVQVPYNDDTAFVTVYFDYDNENLWYAVPVPRVARDANGHPALTVTKYLNASGESSGHLNMDVEVEIPQPALDAIKAAYPDKERGEFQWIATDCYLTFDLPSQPDGAIIQGQASLYGKNRANFNLNLGSEEDLNAVIGAFKGVPTSSFQLEYDMTTLTKLLGVKAKVSFDAQVAIDFETIWKEETDTWGNSKQVAAGVKKNLKVSKAGDVDINWNTPPSDEFRARVTEWAWTTLEKAVTNAVATAQAAAEGGDPVSSVDSFSQEYTETSVIEWDIISTSPLEGFTDSDWNEFIFHEVDNRELSVNFSLKGKLVNEKDESICKEVKITVDYPTKTTGNTFILNPVEEGKTTLTYSAPGNTSGGSYDPNFRYRYETIYSDQDIYDSGWIDSSDTEITIIPNELGAKQVRFVGSNIPFGDEPSEVKKVRIDFFFERPEGYENVTQIAELTSNDDIGHTFSSFFKVPLTNNYSYRFVYELNDGTVRVLNTTEGFGSPNSDILPIQTILKEHTFNLRVARQKNPDLSVDGAYLDVQYVDKQNAEESKAHAFDWEVEWPQSGGGKYQTQPWNFVAVDNPSGSSYILNGEYTDSNWESTEINGVNLQATTSIFKIEPGIAYIGVQFDPANVDWENVASVNLFIFQQTGEGSTAFSREIVQAVRAKDSNSLTRLEGGIYNIERNISFIPPNPDIPNVDRFYIVQKGGNDPDVSFFYSAVYVQKNGDPARDSGEIKVENQSVVVLPANGPEKSIPSIHKMIMDPSLVVKKSKRRKVLN